MNIALVYVLGALLIWLFWLELTCPYTQWRDWRDGAKWALVWPALIFILLYAALCSVGNRVIRKDR